jgi:hypothetical protein
MTIRGMRIIFLPPYSPNFNAIKLAFSALKLWFKKHYEDISIAWTDRQNPSAAPDLLHSLVDQVTPEHATTWFDKCNYNTRDN